MGVTQTEPVTLVGALKLAVVGVATAIAISLKLEPELSAAFVGAAGAVAIVVGMILERAMVFSPATHARDVQEALMTPVPKEV